VRDEAAAAKAKADWRRVQELYRQFKQIIDDPEQTNEPPLHLMGSLAESLGRVLAYYDGVELDFVRHFLAICSEIENAGGAEVERFRRFYRDDRLERLDAYNPRGAGRRRPKPFEAVVETCRRLRDLNEVRDALSSLPTGGILGGSVSYGRFFNTCGVTTSSKSSDTDLLLVLADYGDLRKVIDALTKVPGLATTSLDSLRQRLPTFELLRKSREHCILSHKLKFWDPEPECFLSRCQIPSHYLLSLHVVSQIDFDFIILKDMPVLEEDNSGSFARYVADYRDTEPTRKDNQRSFSGIDFTMELKPCSVEDGFVSEVAVCHISGGRFYPGLHQNLILPQFEIRWDLPSRKLYLPVLAFRWKILERLHEERRLRPFEIQTISLSHTRSALFAPHITLRADRE